MSAQQGAVYFNHGRDSGPWGVKIQHLALLAALFAAFLDDIVPLRRPHAA